MKNKMNIRDLYAKSFLELNQELSKLVYLQLGLRWQKVNHQLINISQFKKLRRDVARVKTVMTILKKDLDLKTKLK